MPTHKTQCFICGKDVFCSSDTHALGCGGEYGEGGCNNPPYIEFCSVEHAEELKRRVQCGIDNYNDLQRRQDAGEF